ncbi:MAG: ribonuclease P protein component [Phycisphaerales bacterium]|nr:ribonuclease P protein component [Phycisphaerales bacterium]
MKKKNGLSKTERLKKRKNIASLFQSGASITQTPIKLYYHFFTNKLIATESKILVGVGTSKSIYPQAVVRNRIKRILREAYRLNKINITHALQHKGMGAHLFFFYQKYKTLTLNEVMERVKKILLQLEHTIQNQTATNE